MSEKFEIRRSEPGDSSAIFSLYPQAFPDEDLLPVVRDLLPDEAVATSLVAELNSEIVGHAIFTKCSVVGRSIIVALLGPLAVAPTWQRQGVGRAIVRAGLRRMQDMGVSVVCVLGDPAYYQRLGFELESVIEPPFRLPDEWAGGWQSQIVDSKMPAYSGKLSVPRQWLRPELWAP